MRRASKGIFAGANGTRRSGRCEDARRGRGGERGADRAAAPAASRSARGRRPISTSGSGSSAQAAIARPGAGWCRGRSADERARAAPRRPAEPADLPPRRGARGLCPGAARGAAGRRRRAFPGRPASAERAAALGPDLDQVEIACEIAARLTATIARARDLAGASLSPRRSPTRRRSGREGCSRLLDYGAAPEAADPAGPPVLVVPSLINRAYILDLAPGRSLLRWLAAQGLRPLLLDWGAPGPAEAGFGLEDYGARAAAAGAGAACGRRPGGRWR